MKEQEESWKESFLLTDNNFSACQRSYERTMKIIQEGLEQCQTWLSEAKTDREQYYHDLAFFPERFETVEEAPAPVATEAPANAA